VRSKQEGTIYQRPDGAWRAQVTVGGKRLGYSSESQRDCREWLKKTLAQVNEGLTYDNSKIELGKYINAHFDRVKHSVRETTLYHNKLLAKNYIIPYLGRRKLVDLKSEHIQYMYDDMISSQVGAWTIIKTHNLLTSILNQAIGVGIISRNPASYTIRPKPPKKEMLILDETQVAHLLASIEGTRWYALIHLALSTGARQMELLGLKWSDIDWHKATLSIERQLKRSKEVTFVPLKTASSERTIELGYQAIAALRKHQALQGANYDLIFTSRSGGPIHHRNLLRDFKALLERLELPIIRFHDLRHTAASLMLANNVPVNIVSRRLGHARPSITLDIYSHLIPSQQQEVARLIDDIITPIPVNVKENSSGN